MNICLIPEKYLPDPGGLAVSAHRLVHGLAARGHTVHVCLATEALPARQVGHTVEGNVSVHRVGASRRSDDTLADWFDAVIALHRTHHFDLLHGYYLVRAGYVTVYAARYLGVPSVVSARGNDLDRTIFDPAKAGATLWTLAHAGAITAVSTDLARRASALAPGRPVHLIHSGVDANQFAALPKDTALLAQLQLADLPTIGFVGEARLKKGLGTLLLAFERAAARHPSQLLLIGGVRGDDADTVRVFQRQHPHLTLRVVPHTSHEQLPARYNLLDVLALPSLHDGLPNALLEGMACERAIVASAVGGIPDALVDGQNGRLVPPGDVDALTNALVALLRSPEQRHALGAAARQTVLSAFNSTRELTANLEVYRSILSDTPPTACPAPPAR
jgi:glycosyltransferase involved in cell wall biosynthesis